MDTSLLDACRNMLMDEQQKNRDMHNFLRGIIFQLEKNIYPVDEIVSEIKKYLQKENKHEYTI